MHPAAPAALRAQPGHMASGPWGRARRASIRFHSFSWKWNTTVLHAGSTTASAPPTQKLPVSSQPTENATQKCREAKVRVLVMAGSLLLMGIIINKKREMSTRSRQKKPRPWTGRGFGRLPGNRTRKGAGVAAWDRAKGDEFPANTGSFGGCRGIFAPAILLQLRRTDFVVRAEIASNWLRSWCAEYR